MAEHAVPSTLCAAFQASAARVPERVALRTPGDSSVLTWAEYAAAVERVAGSLAALGVARGHRVAFLSGNRPELAIAEVASLHLGAAGVALYAVSPPATIEHILHDSEPTVLLVASALAARLPEISHSIDHVLCLDSGQADLPQLAELTSPAGFDYEAAWRAVEPQDLAALIYTSGTTGLSKGVEWTHRAAIGSLSSWDAVLGEADGIRDISYAPFAALAERYGGHWHALIGASTRTLCADPAQLADALLDARPTRMGGPPAVWQRLKRALEATLNADERAVLDDAVDRFRDLTRGRSREPLTSAEQATLAALRARIGLDRTSHAFSTAAPCPLSVHQHYGGLGVGFRELYAMTETGVDAIQRPGLSDFGTLGRALPGYEVRVAEDGEVLVRSSHAPHGYRNRPRETAETYGVDGWIHTGDLGRLDGDGRLQLTGRKKEMIIPEHGVNVAPAHIESALKDACPEIANVCVLGDGRPHLVALVVIDSPERSQDDPAVQSAVTSAVARVNGSLGPRERIEAHAIVAEAWLPGGELTETLKLRRSQIAEKHAAEIEALYG